MNNQVWRGFAYGGLCFAVLLAIAVFAQEYGPIPHLTATFDDIIKIDPYADPASFSRGAKDILSLGWIAPERILIAQYWPPGFMLLEAAIAKAFGLQAPLVLVLQVFACAVWAATMALQRRLLGRFINPLLAAAIPFVPFLFQTPRTFLVERYGVVLGETFSVAFFLSAVMLMLITVEKRRLREAVYAGICFALAAYFRSQYELILLALTGLAVPLIVLSIRSERRGNGQAPYVFIIKSALASLVVAHVLMVPWRAYHYVAFGTPTWVFTSGLIARNSLTTDEDLLKIGGSFVINGGGDLACKLEPSYCGQTSSVYFYKAFFKNFLSWYKAKISLLPSFWYQVTGRDGALFSTLCLLAMIGLLPLLVLCRRYVGWSLIAWITASFYGTFFVIFTLVHFEFRYFYLVKIFSLVSFLNLSVVAWSIYRQRRSDDDPQRYVPRPA